MHADLHIHTIYSDGIFTPKKVVQIAAELALRAISITDHDSVDGIPAATNEAKKTNVEIIPGLELSSSIGKDEIHLLGYFIDWQNKLLEKLLAKMKEARIRRMKKMISLLNEEGIGIRYEDVLGNALAGTIGRLHLARALAKQGMTRDIKEAFDRFIGDGKICYVKHEYLDYREAIGIIRRSGGVPVLAHPGMKGRDEHIPNYIEAGLRGIEVFHTKHRIETTNKYLALTKKYGLIATGGSDCHGENDANGAGILIGKVRVGYEIVELLRKEAEIIRRNK